MRQEDKKMWVVGRKGRVVHCAAGRQKDVAGQEGTWEVGGREGRRVGGRESRRMGEGDDSIQNELTHSINRRLVGVCESILIIQQLGVKQTNNKIKKIATVQSVNCTYILV